MGLLFCPQVMPQKSTSIPSTTTATQMTQRAPQTNSAAAPQTSCARSAQQVVIADGNGVGGAALLLQGIRLSSRECDDLMEAVATCCRRQSM